MDRSRSRYGLADEERPNPLSSSGKLPCDDGCRHHESDKRSGQLVARGDAELGVGVGQVHLHRPDGDEQAVGDVAVAHSPRS